MGCGSSEPKNSIKILKRFSSVDMKITPSIFVVEGRGSFYENYKIGVCLGAGGYGKVYTCMHLETKEIRAVKIIRKQQITTNEETLKKEINVLKQLVCF